MADGVEHPEHYTSHPSGVECIIITQHHNFCVGNAIKYLWRQGLKAGEPSEKDLRKAIEYIQFEIQRLQREKQPSLQELAEEVANTEHPAVAACTAAESYYPEPEPREVYAGPSASLRDAWREAHG